MSEQPSTMALFSGAWRSYLRLGFLLPALVFAIAFIALTYDTDVVNDTVKVQAVCETRAGSERQAAANAVGIELAQVDCATITAVQARRVVSTARFNRVFGLLLLLFAIYHVGTRSPRRVPVATLAAVFTVMAVIGWKYGSIAAPVLVAIKVPFIALASVFENNASLFGRFTHALLVGGLPEELYKALPLLLLLWATMRSREFWRMRLGVSSQLEGMATSAAAAAGYVFAQTYAPLAKSQSIQLLQVQMAVPQVVDGIAGPMALSVIAGYFIAFAVRGPRSRLLYIPGGILIAATLHAIWSAFAGLGGGQSDTIIATIIKVTTFFAALVLIEAARNHAVVLAGTTSTYPVQSEAQPEARAAAHATPRTPSQPNRHTPKSGAATPGHGAKPVTPAKASPLKRYTPLAASPVTPRADAMASAAAAAAAKPVAPPTVSMKASDLAAFAPSVAATGMTGQQPRVARATAATSYVRLTTPANTFIHLNPGNAVRVEQWPGLVSAANDGIVATLLTHPENPSQLGLFNQSNEPWVAWRVGDEFSSAIGAGEVLPLVDGLIIRTNSGDVNVSIPTV